MDQRAREEIAAALLGAYDSGKPIDPPTERHPDLAAEFTKRFPQVKQARSEDEVLEDTSIRLVLSAAIPNERAPLGIRVMQHGKDYMSDKPGIITLEQLAEVRAKIRALIG